MFLAGLGSSLRNSSLECSLRGPQGIRQLP